MENADSPKTTLEKSEQMEILNVGKQTKFEKNQKEGDKQEKLKVMKIWKKLLQKFSLSITSGRAGFSYPPPQSPPIPPNPCSGALDARL